MKAPQPDWAALNALVENNDLGTFWATYAKYLQESGIYSNARIVLFKAALATAKELAVKNEHPL